MCVIMGVEKERITDDMVRAAFETNPKGGGVAWRDTHKQKDGSQIAVVRWKKGIMDVDELIDFAKKLPIPHVLHCRIPTEGGDDIRLCHPFPVTKSVELDLEGYTTNGVLFHNGTWHSWRDKSYEACRQRGIKAPEGKMSDSRMMAWQAYLYGANVLEFINEKSIFFGVKHIGLFGYPTAWKVCNGVWCSNDNWEKHMPKTGGVSRPTQADTTPTSGVRIETQSPGGSPGGSRQPAGFLPPGPAALAGLPPEISGEVDEAATENFEEGVQASLPTGVVNAAVQALGQSRIRRPLMEDKVLADEYRRAIGRPISEDRDWPLNINPKRYHRSTPVDLPAM